eukprot:10177368-Alexandrium_andersonii.AAC.1
MHVDEPEQAPEKPADIWSAGQAAVQPSLEEAVEAEAKRLNPDDPKYQTPPATAAARSRKPDQPSPEPVTFENDAN